MINIYQEYDYFDENERDQIKTSLQTVSGKLKYVLRSCIQTLNYYANDIFSSPSPIKLRQGFNIFHQFYQQLIADYEANACNFVFYSTKDEILKRMIQICVETKDLELVESTLSIFELMGKKPKKFDSCMADAGISCFCVMAAELDQDLLPRILKLLVNLTPQISSDSKERYVSDFKLERLLQMALKSQEPLQIQLAISLLEEVHLYKCPFEWVDIESHFKFLVDCIPYTPESTIPPELSACANLLCINIFFTNKKYYIIQKRRASWLMKKLGKFPVLLFMYGEKLFYTWQQHLFPALNDDSELNQTFQSLLESENSQTVIYCLKLLSNLIYESHLQFAIYLCKSHVLSATINRLLTAQNQTDVRLWAIYLSRWMFSSRMVHPTRCNNFQLEGHPRLYVQFLKDQQYRITVLTQIILILKMESIFDRQGVFMKNFVKHGGANQVMLLCESPKKEVSTKAQNLLKIMYIRDIQIKKLIQQQKQLYSIEHERVTIRDMGFISFNHSITD